MPEKLTEATFAKLKWWARECTYSVRNYTEKDAHVEYYTIKRITEEQLEEIKTVTTDKVQAVLSKYI